MSPGPPALALALTLALGGCTTARTAGICQRPLTPSSGADPSPALERAMTAWARRDDPARLAEAVTRFRAAATAAPDRVDLQLRLADALYLQADGVHRFGRDYHAMRRGFAESTRAAERAVAASNPGFVRAACAGRGWKRAVALLERKDVPAVYLWIAALGKTGLSESVLTILGHTGSPTLKQQWCLTWLAISGMSGPKQSSKSP